MEKRNNKYKLKLEQVQLASDKSESQSPLEFEFNNHDEIFNIINVLKAKNPFNDPDQAVEFALGLKLFSEVMIKNRTHPLFEELLPAFKIFMQKLKAM